MRVFETGRFRYRLIFQRTPLLKVSQVRECPTKITEHNSVGVFCLGGRIGTANLRIPKSITSLKNTPRSSKFTLVKMHGALQKVSHQDYRSVLFRFPDSLHLLSNWACQSVFGSNQVINPTSIEDRNQIVWSIEFLSQRISSLVRLADLRC